MYFSFPFQVTEPCSLIPVTHGARQLVLVGDHKQLGPCITSPGESAGLAVTLFERLLEAGVESFPLHVQYRMHPALAAFPSAEFYAGTLQTRFDTARYKPPGPLTRPLTFRHVAGWETPGASKSNAPQAEAVTALVSELCRSGDVPPTGIGVITPYRSMVGLLRSRFLKDFPAVEVNTVDGFQGREKDVIVFGCVRANSAGSLGFLADRRRMNVALTRAKRACVVVGHKPTLLSGQSLWAKWLRESESKS